MKIIADENLAYVDYFFSQFGEIKTHAGRTLQKQDLIDCDALLVRSVTAVNANLLTQTPVQFVGSATIGTDHIDIAYLNARQISWANAAGCNAQAVAEYVITALLNLKPALIDAGQKFCLGIVGLGNVGRRLAQLGQQLEWQVIGYDPFVQNSQVEQVEFTELLHRADAVSIHVPLTKVGPHATQHLFNQNVLNQLKPHTILINSARGSVVVEQDLIQDIEKNHRQVVLDVFEHEPVISQRLLQLLAIATPHIAGYSLEGKARGTQMIYQAFCQKFDQPADKDFTTQLQSCPSFFKNQNFKQALIQNLMNLYDIQRDNDNLHACIENGLVNQQAFDQLRKNYPLRREWSAYGA
ncbi:4-phosphoerythronate dehydrogenase [Acinetobacter qingfengensis]|uniref:Erythronate-4-phosphate dehydrogenase n=1 Tax=Acinetobacter qingfengensis TaxID=1262585 RepID=A0A1E7REQ4_9GAMM|nr:4-phosphoerythronate dehydrogenase [Acinetobacter qingfengensis]KAA8731176.1 4-phosphoerythronate dehydrogenase [Acinetobacter qingfengensis]OEY97844.1 erythronate-4-phosphate dehydrogenase [Acinetobacter qingfengensis]